MPDSAPSLQFAVMDETLWIKVSGRANCVIGVDFQKFVQSWLERGVKKFALELSECVLMDSSFLGVLGGLESELLKVQDPKNRASVILVSANERVQDLIQNLGLDEYFTIAPPGTASPDQWMVVPSSPNSPNRLECTRMSLDAHRVIVRLNPENESKFREVIEFLDEDKRRMENEQDKKGESGT